MAKSIIGSFMAAIFIAWAVFFEAGRIELGQSIPVVETVIMVLIGALGILLLRAGEAAE